MLRTPDDVQPDQVVYLYPHSRVAGRWCWMQKQAVVVDSKRLWPLIHVKVTHDGQEYDAYPSRDDVRVRPSAKPKEDKKEGDGTSEAGRTVPASFRKRAAFSPHKPLALNPGEEEGTLF